MSFVKIPLPDPKNLGYGKFPFALLVVKWISILGYIEYVLYQSNNIRNVIFMFSSWQEFIVMTYVFAFVRDSLV